MAVPNIVAGSNSFITLAEANDYLISSVRATAWEFSVDDDTKKRSLITATRIFERQIWQGTSAGTRIVDTVAVNAGGTGYAVNDILTASGGTGGINARVTVTAVSGGVVTAVSLLDTGSYSVEPTNPVATTGGGGSGCTLDFTFKDQVLYWPAVDVIDRKDESVDGTTIPQQIKDGLAELAYDISQDLSIETSGGEGSNVKKAKAGSAEVTFFRPTGGANGTGTFRFEPHIQELVGQFLEGAATSAPFASGTDNESQFDDDSNDLVEGYA